MSQSDLPKIIVLDIETEPFDKYFKRAKYRDDRVRHVPKPIIACVYNVFTNKYLYFLPKDFKKLAELMKSSDFVVTFNGTEFDFLVIRKHLRTSSILIHQKKNIDLFKVASVFTNGAKVSLDKLLKLNFNENKLIKKTELGKGSLSLKALKEGCKSDVAHTYRLFKLLVNLGFNFYIDESYHNYYHATDKTKWVTPHLCPYENGYLKFTRFTYIGNFKGVPCKDCLKNGNRHLSEGYMDKRAYERLIKERKTRSINLDELWRFIPYRSSYSLKRPYCL